VAVTAGAAGTAASDAEGALEEPTFLGPCASTEAILLSVPLSIGERGEVSAASVGTPVGVPEAAPAVLSIGAGFGGGATMNREANSALGITGARSGGGMTALITAAALGPSKGARAMGGVGPLDPEPDANFGAIGDVAAEREGWAGAWAGGGDTGRTGKTKELLSVLMGSAGFGMRGSLAREAVCLRGLGTIGCSRFRFTGARAGGSGAIGAITKLGRRTG